MVTYHEQSEEEGMKQGAEEERKFTSANSLIDSPSVLLLSYNFHNMPAVKKEQAHS